MMKHALGTRLCEMSETFPSEVLASVKLEGIDGRAPQEHGACGAGDSTWEIFWSGHWGLTQYPPSEPVSNISKSFRLCDRWCMAFLVRGVICLLNCVSLRFYITIHGPLLTLLSYLTWVYYLDSQRVSFDFTSGSCYWNQSSERDATFVPFTFQSHPNRLNSVTSFSWKVFIFLNQRRLRQ